MERRIRTVLARALPLLLLLIPPGAAEAQRAPAPLTYEWKLANTTFYFMEWIAAGPPGVGPPSDPAPYFRFRRTPRQPGLDRCRRVYEREWRKYVWRRPHDMSAQAMQDDFTKKMYEADWYCADLARRITPSFSFDFVAAGREPCELEAIEVVADGRTKVRNLYRFRSGMGWTDSAAYPLEMGDRDHVTELPQPALRFTGQTRLRLRLGHRNYPVNLNWVVPGPPHLIHLVFHFRVGGRLVLVPLRPFYLEH